MQKVGIYPFLSLFPPFHHLSQNQKINLSISAKMGTHHPILYLFILSMLLASAVSEIRTTNIVSDPRPIIEFERFGFVPNGRAAVSVEAVSWAPPSARVNLASLGFFLVPDGLLPFILNVSDFCDLSRFSLGILTFNSLKNSAASNAVDITIPDEYILVFAKCDMTEIEVTMSVRTEFYNLDGSGKKDYLPDGKSHLPEVYLFFFLVYCAFLVAWVVVCHRQRATMERIHLVMGALLLFKALKLICAAEDLWHVRSNGTPHGWDVAFYVFSFFKGVLLFTVIVLIGTGWSFLKPYLQEREKNVLMIVIPMQVIENIASVVIGEGGPAEQDWMTWKQIFLLVDLVCCFAVFFPIIWSIRSLKEASKTDGKAARNLKKLTLFKQFYGVVVGYIYFTRVIALALEEELGYSAEFAVAAVVELVSLAFYVFMFHNFQPVERNPYLYVADTEEQAAAEALEMEESFEL